MRFLILLVLTFLFSSHVLSATPVNNFSAFYSNGQVFCRWENLTLTGIEYRLYRSSSPILHGNQLINCQYLGAVKDSSSYNQHLSEVQGIPLYLKIDSLGDPLSASEGLFVATSDQEGNFYYALTTFASGSEDTLVISGVNSLTDPVSELVERPQAVHQVTFNMNNMVVKVYVLFATFVSTPLFPQMINVGSFPFNFSVVKIGTFTPCPLTIRLAGGGGDFLSGLGSGASTNEYRIGLDDWLPNGENSLWFGYHENYDVFSTANSPPVSGMNYDYALERLQYTIDWAIRHLPIDSNSIYFVGASKGASGAFLSSLYYPSRIAAASMSVPKFDLSFLYDPDTTNNYNAGMPGRLRIDTLIGTVPSNLMTNFGVHTYDLLNGGWLVHQHANDNVPLLFAVNGKRDTMVGWAEKIAYYDSVNSNRLGGFYFWDNRKHNGDGKQWIMAPNLIRYRRNLSFPAFSNCSFNNDPGDGHADSGDSLGTINGFLDWNDMIEDDTNYYQIKLFLHDLSTYYGPVIAPDSCFTDVTLRRLQQFYVPVGALILWETKHLGELVQQHSFLYTGGLITLNEVKVFRDTTQLNVSYTIPTNSAQPVLLPGVNISVYPNPNDGVFVITYLSGLSCAPCYVRLSDLSGKILEQQYFNTANNEILFLPQKGLVSGIYIVQVYSDSQHSVAKLIAVQ